MVDEVAILGAGMHPWGKWGRNFVEYGVKAARDALADAGIEWTDVQFVAGADTMRNGYPGYVAGATFAQALGWTGTPVASTYGACATGAQAIQAARTQILAGLCDVALVVGADAAPKGFFAPQAGERFTDPDWLRFRLVGATNPVYFGLYARRRMEIYGATELDFAKVKVKNSRHGYTNPNARYKKAFTIEEVLESPMVSDPLRLLQICATSDGGAALVLSSMDYARKHTKDPVRIAAVSTVTPRFPQSVIEMPNLSTDSAAGAALPDTPFKDSITKAAYEEAGVGPEDVNLAEVYDLSSALELDWYEQIGLCKPGEAEKLLNDGDTTLGGRVPVNPSGGLGCFGEAVPAQAIAQVCELTWQLRGQAGERQVEGARLGVTVNQGLFGSSRSWSSPRSNCARSSFSGSGSGSGLSPPIAGSTGSTGRGGAVAGSRTDCGDVAASPPAGCPSSQDSRAANASSWRPCISRISDSSRPSPLNEIEVQFGLETSAKPSTPMSAVMEGRCEGLGRT
jgi:acetyl-CoA acetyltransferase